MLYAICSFRLQLIFQFINSNFHNYLRTLKYISNLRHIDFICVRYTFLETCILENRTVHRAILSPKHQITFSCIWKKMKKYCMYKSSLIYIQNEDSFLLFIFFIIWPCHVFVLFAWHRGSWYGRHFSLYICLVPNGRIIPTPSMYYFYAFHKCSRHTKKQNHNLHFRFNWKNRNDCLYRFCNIIYKYDSNFFVFQICWPFWIEKNADEFIIHWDFDSDRFPGFSNTLHYS